MKNFTRILIATSLVVMVAFNSYSQDVFKSANVGIGTTTPAQKLDVAGNVKFSGALMPMPGGVANAGLVGNILLSGGAGAPPTWLANGSNGYVLTSSSGTPTWTSASTALPAWYTTGNSFSSYTYGTYFIGPTNTSSAPLEFYANNAYAGVIDPTNLSIYLGAGAGNDASALTAATDNVGIGWGTLALVASGNDYNTAIGYNALPSYKSTYNTAVGAYALYSNTTSGINTALGYSADYSVTTGSYNDAIGFDANYWNQTGVDNVVAGDSAMFGNAPVVSGTGTAYTTSSYNTAIGVAALSGIGSSSTYNTAVGYEAERHITTGVQNTGIGVQVNYGITTGDYNTGVGYQANYNTTTSQYNTGVGYQANFSNVQSYGNVAVGANALYSNTESGNTAIGTNALYYNNIGNVSSGPNTAIGDSAMYINYVGVKNVAVGYAALTAAGQNGATNNLNTAIGYFSMVGAGGSLTTVSNNVNIGAYTDATYTQESNDVAVGAYALSEGAATSNPQEDVAIGAFAMYGASIGANYDIAIGAGTGSSSGPLGDNGSTTGFTGSNDIAIGYEAGNITADMTTGNYNTYLGYETYGATTQSQNTAVGATAAAGSTTASANSNDVAIGYGATAYGYATTTNATAIGSSATSTGTSTTAIGASANAGASGAASSATAIGASSTASASNATAIGPLATASTANTVIIGDAGYVNGGSQINVGIGTTTPARELEVAGTSNTIRVDGLESGGTFNQQITSIGNIVYTNNVNGDLYSLPNGANGQVLTLSSGVPTWAASTALPTATAPLSVTGSVISLVGPTGSVLVGTGTGSEFLGTGSYGDVLEGQGAGTLPVWTTLATLEGVGDNWGSQVAVTDSDDAGDVFPTASADNTITGNGLSASPLRLAKQNATNNEVLLWNSSLNTWRPGTASSSLATYNIANGGVSSVVVIGGGYANSVVGSGNVTVDVKGTAGGVLYGTGAGTSAVFTTAGATGQVLESNGSSAPTWTTLALTTGWTTTGNLGTIPGTNYIGTTTDAGFDFEVYGANAGAIDPLNTSSSAANVYLGAASTSAPILNGAGNNDAGDNNVAIGLSALGSAGGPSYVGGLGASTGYISSNVAVGVYALSSAVYGGFNTALGAWSQRLFNYPGANTTTGNTSVGAYSLYSNSKGEFNTSQGYYSMYGSGSATAVGNFNTAEGYKALYTATAGIASNTAIGSNALYNAASSKNTAVGDSALASSTSGNYNTGLGYDANVSTGTISNATAIGAYAQAAQSNTIVLGQISGVGSGTANTNVGIGTNTPDVDAGLAIKTLHLETQQTTSPGITTSNGTSSASVTGTDVGGVINFTVPASGGTGTQVAVNFVSSYSVAPSVIITAANSNTGAIMGTYLPYVSNVTTGGFTINFTSAPSASVPLQFYYFVIETQ